MKQKKCQEGKQKYYEVKNENHRFLIDLETGECVGDVLSDKNSAGKEKPWAEKKKKNLQLAQAYSDIADEVKTEYPQTMSELDGSEMEADYWTKKSERIADCASWLRFGLFDTGDGGIKKRLLEMHTCKSRLCPLCTWRRSRKTQTQMRKILDAMEADGKRYAYIFATFTVPNVSGDELEQTIRSMMEAWNRFRGYKAFQSAVKGWFRSLEITHNVNPKSKSFDTYHPHFHCIFAVNRSYFKKKTYISREKWLAMWQKATCNPNITQVYVRRIKPKDKNQPMNGENMIKAICEVSKYTLKDSGYILPENWDTTLKSVRTLDGALAHKRLTAWGGVIEEYRKKLMLDDNENGNLVTDEKGDDGMQIGEECYVFRSGYQQYMLDKREECGK